MKIDATSMSIIRHLRNGAMSVPVIAKDLKLSETTVRCRLRKLKKDAVLKITGLVDPDQLDNHFIALVGVCMNKATLVDKTEAFSRLKGVVSVGNVTGHFDIMLQVLLNGRFGLYEFITTEVAKIDGVTTVDTFVLYKTMNWNVPYPL